jgi:tetratricopeptide (TPR) repeat protein
MKTILILLISLLMPLVAPAEDVTRAYLRASYLLQSGEPQQALTELKEAIKLDPTSGHLHTVYGSTLLMMGNVLEGQMALEKAIELDPDNSKPYKLLGVLLFRQIAEGDVSEKQANKAVELLQKAASLNENDIESRYYLAFLYEEQGETQKMYEMLKAAVAIDNTRPELLKKAAETAEKLDYKREAADYYERASLYLEKLATRLKDNLNLQFELAKTSLWDTGKYDVAVTAYDRVIEATRGDMSMLAYRIEAEVGKATALYFMEDYQPAKELFEEQEQFVITRYPRSIAPMLLTYSRTDKIERALELADRLLQEQKNNPPFYNFILRVKGACLGNAERYKKAAKVFERSLRENTGESLAYQQYAQIWIDAEEFEKAEEVIERAEKQFGANHSDVLFVKAVLAEEQENFDKAMNLLRKVIQQEPDNDLALNFLGYMFAEEKQNLEEAEKYLTDALEISPNQGSYLDSLGWVYFQKGNMDLAEKYLKKAYRTKYMTPEVREHLGFLYLELGKKENALEEFRAAIELGLDTVKEEKEVDRVRQKIKELEQELGRE